MMLRKTLGPPAKPTRAAGASMRPQHDAAENSNSRTLYGAGIYASMRPQHDAAENVVAQVG